MLKIVSDGTTRDTVKAIATLVTGISVSSLCHNVIKNNVAVPPTNWGKAKIIIGSAVLVSAITSKTDEHVEVQIDKFFDLGEKVRTYVKEAKDGSSQSAG
jgi:hypothetical protein